ncbi:uncharacterized protein LOC144115906 [Amblyomma americanum]
MSKPPILLLQVLPWIVAASISTCGTDETPFFYATHHDSDISDNLFKGRLPSMTVTSPVASLQKELRDAGAFRGHGTWTIGNMSKPPILLLQVLPSERRGRSWLRQRKKKRAEISDSCPLSSRTRKVFSTQLRRPRLKPVDMEVAALKPREEDVQSHSTGPEHQLSCGPSDYHDGEAGTSAGQSTNATPVPVWSSHVHGASPLESRRPEPAPLSLSPIGERRRRLVTDLPFCSDDESPNNSHGPSAQISPSVTARKSSAPSSRPDPEVLLLPKTSTPRPAGVSPTGLPLFLTEYGVPGYREETSGDVSTCEDSSWDAQQSLLRRHWADMCMLFSDEETPQKRRTYPDSQLLRSELRLGSQVTGDTRDDHPREAASLDGQVPAGRSRMSTTPAHGDNLGARLGRLPKPWPPAPAARSRAKSV